MIRGSARLENLPTSDAQLALMKTNVKDTAADRPGVYRMLSSDGEILYVGKSKRVRSRLLSYFRCAYPEEKGARILRSAEKIEWDYMNLRARNAPEAAPFIKRPEYRKGWADILKS